MTFFKKVGALFSGNKGEPVEPVTAHDVAAYIIRRLGGMTTMKLQKLVYYCQAWSLVWDEEPLFRERVEAWANGPVVRELYDRHRGAFRIRTWDGHPENLTQKQRETIDAVLNFYGDKPSQWLSNLTHQEDPWRDARRGLGPTDPGRREITHESMAEYYSTVAAA